MTSLRCRCGGWLVLKSRIKDEQSGTGTEIHECICGRKVKHKFYATGWFDTIIMKEGKV